MDSAEKNLEIIINCCKKNKLYFSFIHVLSYCTFPYCYTHDIFKVLWT